MIRVASKKLIQSKVSMQAQIAKVEGKHGVLVTPELVRDVYDIIQQAINLEAWKYACTHDVTDEEAEDFEYEEEQVPTDAAWMALSEIISERKNGVFALT